MKISKVAIAITSLLVCSNVYATTVLKVWDDVQKSHGIAQAVADFEALNDCKVVVEEVGNNDEEISIEDAQSLKKRSKVGDTIDIEINAENFKINLSKLITPDMSVYQELKSCIFDRK